LEMKKLALPSFYILFILLMFHALVPAQSEIIITESSFPEIRMTLADRQFTKMQNEKGNKMTLKEVNLDFNGNPAQVKDVHLRGKNTLNFIRKSFSIDLDEPLQVTIDGQAIDLKKFDLLNLAMDKNLWHNRWSFLMLSRLGIFPPVNSYCTVWINDQPQGIYLLVEKPQAAMGQFKSPYMIRRGEGHAIDHEYRETSDKEALKAYKKQYYDLYNTGQLKGKTLYDNLADKLNTESYFKWLAFNYFVKNGDYADELFLYIDPNTDLFEVMAWDYDDLLMDYPHEGRTARYQILKDRMIFSLEDQLDKTIAADDYVYEHYKRILKMLLENIDNAVLETLTQQVLNELKVVGAHQKHAKVTRYLDKTPFKIEEAVYDMDRTVQFLKLRRTVLLDEL
ncbi:MAG: CotH kinase family protein, partial [Flavobacteriaceae bacterium]